MPEIPQDKNQTAQVENSSGPPSSLVQAVGVVGLAAGVFNCTVGGGIFRLPGVVYEMAGAAAPIVYVICGVAALLIMFTFVTVGRRISKTGGPYAYVEEEFGAFPGFIAGLLVWLVGVLSMSSVATAFVENIVLLAPNLQNGVFRALVIVSAFSVMSFINIRGVEAGNRANIVMTVLKLIPLAILILVAVPNIEFRNIQAPRNFDFASLSRAAIVLMFAFMGIESALVPSGEVKNPERTVPRGLILGLGSVVILYLLLQIAAQGVLGASMSDPNTKAAPLVAAASALLGQPGKYLLLIGTLVSMLGYMSAMTLAIPRALFVMGEKRILPRIFSSVHPKFHSPQFAITVNSAIVVLLAITSSFEKLAIIANLSALLLYVLCALAAAKITKGIPWVPIFTCLILAALLTSITLTEWLMVGGVLAAGSLLYFVSQRRRIS